MNMTYGKDGMDLTEQSEGCRLKAYQDQGGVWTNGYGNTHNVKPGSTITQEQAEADLQGNLAWAVSCVNTSVETPLTQDQFNALVDFTFNVGCPAFQDSTMLRYLNAGDTADAALQFARWDKVGGLANKGLDNRRAAELAEFNDTDGV